MSSVCPAGKTLITRGTLVNDGATLLYRASKFRRPRPQTPLLPVRNPRARCRSLFKGARDLARRIGSEADRASTAAGKKIEMLLAHLVRIIRQSIG